MLDGSAHDEAMQRRWLHAAPGHQMAMETREAARLGGGTSALIVGMPCHGDGVRGAAALLRPAQG